MYHIFLSFLDKKNDSDLGEDIALEVDGMTET